MLPRKRLQVLLYILRIIYVFGDGDPGAESLSTFNEFPDNLVDEPGYTTPYAYHRIHERVTSAEDERLFNLSQEVYNANYELGDEGNADSQDNDIMPAELELPHVVDTVVENVTVLDVQPNSLNVTWAVSGDLSPKYIVNLYVKEELVTSDNTSEMYYFFKDLQPCTDYKVEVSVFELTASDVSSNHATATTSFLKPSRPGSLNVVPAENTALKIEWQPPETAANCVENYLITIDTASRGNRDLRKKNTSDTNVTFEKLYACTSYSVSVFPIDKNGDDGPVAFTNSTPTHPRAFIAPRLNTTDPNSNVTTKSSISLVWDVTDETNNCLLKSVESECRHNYTEGHGMETYSRNRSVELSGNENPKDVAVTIDKLSPYSHYDCRARVIIRDSILAQSSPWSAMVHPVTQEDVTSPPVNFQPINNGDITKLTFKWDPPDFRPGKLLVYRIIFRWKPTYAVPDNCEMNRTKVDDLIDSTRKEYSIKIEDIYSNSDYTASISARTGAGWSPEETIEDKILERGVPDKVTDLRCEIKPDEDDPNTLNTILSWSLPCSSKGLLHYFEVSAYGTRLGYEDHNITDIVRVPEKVEKNDKFDINLRELRPLYHYVFEVSATLYGSIDAGDINTLSVDYPSGIPTPPSEDYVKPIKLDPQKYYRTTTSAFVLLPLFSEENGKIKYYAVMVSSVSFANSSARFNFSQHTWPNVSSWKEAKEKDFTIPYQATELMWTPSPDNIKNYGHIRAVKFVIGEDSTCPQVSENTNGRVYCNGPLNPDSWYEVRMRAFTDQGYADSASFVIKTNAELNLGLVLGVVFGILFIGTTTTLMLMIKRCSPRLLVQRILQSSIPESPVPNPLTRRKFVNHCQQLAENPGKLSNEFQLLQTLSIDLIMPSNTACLQANRKKNRYSDILPYDFSRVKLDIIDNDPNSDYINASFITGYSGHEEYIACQGPKEETTHDFWRMIDQYDVKMILMLTQLVERGKEKCHQYYPTIRETFTYERFSIKCTSELDYRNYTQRTLLMEKDDCKRTITHLHFKDWPDHDVPDDFDAMLHFCQMYRKQLTTVKGLAVIHCSAGIGRTGTLIAIDILLQSLRDNRKIDVFGTVYRLRRHRLNMVQRESQYAYIYNCIRQVLKNPYFSKTYKPPPIDPIYTNTQTDRSDSSTDLVESFDTLRKNSLSSSMDSMQPLCQSSPQTAPKIQMNGLRYCKSTSAIDTRSNHNRIGKCNSEKYIICETQDSFSTSSKESAEAINLKNSASSSYENVETLLRLNSFTSSCQTVAGTSHRHYFRLKSDAVKKDTSL